MVNEIYLHEEYVERHALQIPIVCVGPDLCMFLRSEIDPRIIKSVNIFWKKNEKRPDYFNIYCLSPVHNSYNGSNDSLIMNRHCFAEGFVDNYESSVLSLVDTIKKMQLRVVPFGERNLIIWNFFLLIADHWLSQNMDSKFFANVEESTRPDYDLNRRRIAYRQACIQLKKFPVVDEFRSCLVNYMFVGNYAEWFAKLINV